MKMYLSCTQPFNQVLILIIIERQEQNLRQKEEKCFLLAKS